MTDTYSNMPDDPGNDTDTTGADDQSNGKMSQQQAQYGRGTPMKHCGVCNNYEGGDQCSRVESPVSGFGLSNCFSMQTNPFGSTIGPREAQMINGMMQSGPDQSPHVAATQIGTRRY